MCSSDLHSTPTEGKFNLAYTIALGLTGHRVTAFDFTPERLNDPAIGALAAKVESAEREDIDRTQARLEITLADGRTLTDETRLAYGSVGNPMQWPDLEAKFMAMAEPVLGANATVLLATLRSFEKPGSLARADRKSTRLNSSH